MGHQGLTGDDVNGGRDEFLCMTLSARNGYFVLEVYRLCDRIIIRKIPRSGHVTGNSLAHKRITLRKHTKPTGRPVGST